MIEQGDGVAHRARGLPGDEGERFGVCLQVFALGGASRRDNATETGYFTVRVAMAKAISEAARHIAQKGLIREGAPVLARFIAQVTSRFGIVVSEKIAAQTVPVIGAVSGALINTVFTDHFQGIARGHFVVRRLERKYTQETIRSEYLKI